MPGQKLVALQCIAFTSYFGVNKYWLTVQLSYLFHIYEEIPFKCCILLIMRDKIIY